MLESPLPAAPVAAPKWQTAIFILVVFGGVLVDQIAPPFGIPLSLLAIWGIHRFQKGSWQPLGLGRPPSWGKTILLSVVVVIFIKLFALFVLDPLVKAITDVPKDLSAYESIEGNHQMLIVFLVVSWTTAGFGEEVIFRGYLMSRLAHLFGQASIGWVVALIVQSLVFGLIHVRQGPAGMIQTGAVGLIFGLLYLLNHKNLWANYLAHAMTNTVSFLLIYSGLYKAFM